MQLHVNSQKSNVLSSKKKQSNRWHDTLYTEIIIYLNVCNLQKIKNQSINQNTLNIKLNSFVYWIY